MSRRDLGRLVVTVPGIGAIADGLRRHGAPIFALHRVLPAGTECYDPEMNTSLPVFAGFLEWLAQSYNVVPLGELVQNLKRWGVRDRLNGKPICALTFDDGWSDTFEHAFPLLRQFGFPATIFLVTDFIGTDGRFWQEELWYAMRHIAMNQPENHLIENTCHFFPWCPEFSATTPFGELRSFLLTRASVEAQEFVSELARRSYFAGAPAKRVFMNWKEVRAMMRENVEFGGHTAGHCLLTQTDPQSALHEVQGCADRLQEELGSSVSAFSYPWGSYNAQLSAMVKAAGFAYAVSAAPAFCRPDSECLALPRVFIADSVIGRQGAFSASDSRIYFARVSLRKPGRPISLWPGDAAVTHKIVRTPAASSGPSVATTNNIWRLLSKVPRFFLRIIFGRYELHVLSLEGSVNAPPLPPDLVLREGDRDDVLGFASQVPSHWPPRRLRKRLRALANGDKVYFVTQGERLVYMEWVSPADGLTIRDFGVNIPVPGTGPVAVFYDAWTDPAFRGKGIFSASKRILASRLHREGRTVWSCIESWNLASLRGNQKAGSILKYRLIQSRYLQLIRISRLIPADVSVPGK